MAGGLAPPASGGSDSLLRNVEQVGGEYEKGQFLQRFSGEFEDRSERGVTAEQVEVRYEVDLLEFIRASGAGHGGSEGTDYRHV
jgi:hypothetical protein